MATLTSGSGEVVDLLAHHLVGRGPGLHTRIQESIVSAQHAVLQWNGTHWSVRDLASRNGTFVHGRRISPQEPTPLTVGSTVWFGGPTHAFTLTDASPPEPVARSEHSLVRGEDLHLALPSPDEPDLLVHFVPGEGWTASSDDSQRAVSSGESIEVRGVAYTLDLPLPLAATVDAHQAAPAVAALSLRFSVSRDQEYVEVTASAGAEAHSLKARAHHTTLYELARARLDDRQAGASLSEEGWVYTSDLAKRVGITRNQLYLHLHRCRKELKAVLGIAQHAVARRVTTQQVRLHTSDVVITDL